MIKVYVNNKINLVCPNTNMEANNGRIISRKDCGQIETYDCSQWNKDCNLCSVGFINIEHLINQLKTRIDKLEENIKALYEQIGCLR